jgi:hypothetical protein
MGVNGDHVAAVQQGEIALSRYASYRLILGAPEVS